MITYFCVQTKPNKMIDGGHFQNNAIWSLKGSEATKLRKQKPEFSNNSLYSSWAHVVKSSVWKEWQFIMQLKILKRIFIIAKYKPSRIVQSYQGTKQFFFSSAYIAPVKRSVLYVLYYGLFQRKTCQIVHVKKIQQWHCCSYTNYLNTDIISAW